MTVITKSLGDKKSDNLKDPLVENIVVEHADEGQRNDVEAGAYPIPPPQATRYIISARVRPYYSLMLIIMLFLLVATSILGIFGTEYLYDQYKYIVGSEKPAVYRAFSPLLSDEDISSMTDDNKVPFRFEKISDPEQENILSFFSSRTFQEGSNNAAADDEQPSKTYEDLQLDMDGNRYEKIDIPSKTASRFVHDFQSNFTAIVDVDNKRCFIMPLDRSVVLPPKSLFDLLFKMSNGYYSMDTEKVRRDMRVVEPPLDDISSLGLYIQQECDGFTSYNLEKFVGGVVKRSIENSADFTVLEGNKLFEFHIVGLPGKPKPAQ